MKLLLDLGNSNLSWAVSGGPEWRIGKPVPAEVGRMAGVMAHLFASLPAPESVWISSVGKQSLLEEINSWLNDRWSVRPSMILPSGNAFGVSNCYREPSSLGADRWAALIAVRHRYKIPACIVDAGTAVTIDLLDDQSRFLGGCIYPGLQSIRRVLVSSTANLSMDIGDEDRCLACSTADAIAAGTRAGWIGGIRQILDRQQAESDLVPHLYITGGNGKLLAQAIDRHHQLVPDLVLQGLDVISELSA